MNLHNLERFKELERSCGNRYLAIRFISTNARDLGQDNQDYHISESYLIEWVLTGKCPYTEQELARRKEVHENVDNINEYLSYVDDEDIRDEVRKLYKTSVQTKHLTYCTNKALSRGRRSRVNVLLRMIWYHFSL